MGEFIITAIFTIEYLLRISVADSLVRYFKDVMNLFDILAILPFYVDALRAKSFNSLNFAVLASAPMPLGFVVLRSFKVSG